MVTLNDLMIEKKMTGMSDLEVIREYFTRNDLESDAIRMLSELSAIKVEKLELRIQNFKTWAYYLPSQYLYETYDLETATKLHQLELNYLANDRELSISGLRWATENIPNIKEPEVYFRPLMDWLEKKGIKFAEMKQNK